MVTVVQTATSRDRYKWLDIRYWYVFFEIKNLFVPIMSCVIKTKSSDLESSEKVAVVISHK